MVWICNYLYKVGVVKKHEMSDQTYLGVFCGSYGPTSYRIQRKKKIHSMDAQRQDPWFLMENTMGKMKKKNAFLAITLDWIKIERSSFLLCVTFLVLFEGTPHLAMFQIFFMVYGWP